MKHEWRKKEKSVYIPKNKPEVIDVPEYKFITIAGEGNPNSEFFGECIAVLYALSYAIKMNLKRPEYNLPGHYDYTVYPLEGVWDINDAGKENFTGTINKDDLIFKIMIRQPDFVTDEFFKEMLEFVKNKKTNELLDKACFETIKEGRCIQMLHIGSYDNEPVSFDIMEAFAEENSLKRKSKIHREIYLSDFRKVAEDKLKTVLRFQLD